MKTEKGSHMKAVVLEGIEKAVYKDIERPKCDPDGIVIKIDAVGLCGSDVRTYSNGVGGLDFPFVLGHENVGTVCETGKESEGFSIGDRVIVNPVIPCGKCFFCEKGMHNLCSNRLTYGHHLKGGFAEYMAVPGIGVKQGQILKLADDVKSEDVVVVELLSSVVNAQKLAGTSLGDTVVIIGCGPLGCLHSEIARLRGAKNIIMANRSRKRLDHSRKFSGTHFVNTSEESLRDAVMDVTGGLGADIVINATPATKPIEEGVYLLRKGGKLVIFGGLPKDSPCITLDANLLHYSEINVVGGFSTTNESFRKAFEIVSAGLIKADIVSHVLPLKDMEKGVKMLKRGEAFKVILKPSLK